MKSSIFRIIIILVAAGVVFLAYEHRGQEEPNLKVFQPDSQVLNDAVHPENALSAEGLPYVYNKNECVGDPAPLYICLSGYYKKVVENYGISAATDDIKLRSNENQSVLAECHPLMHVIGRAAANKFDTISGAFANGDSFCWSGYYHGIMEGMIDKIGIENLPKEMNKICADIPGKDTYDFNYFNCVHGLGHGVMALLEDEVFDSLKMCDNLAGSWERESCYGGVYMQNIIDSTNVADTDNVVKYLKPNDPLYPCTAVDPKYKGQCYLGQTSYVLQVNGYNYKNAFGLCAGVEEPYRDICNQSMGRDVANQAGHDGKKTKDFCALASTAGDRQNCIVGAVKEIISYYHADSQALQYCSLYSGDDKNICSNTAKEYYSYF
jgi:hypothetical protein